LVMCQKASYLKEFTTSVVSCEKVDNGYLTILEDTILFPEGGGQPSDTGTIEDVPIISVFRDTDDVVKHILPVETDVGSSVKVCVDWDRRFDHMQQHTAQHLLSALADSMFGAKTLSWQLGKEQSTIDFSLKDFSDEQLGELEDAANAHIRNCVNVNYKEIRTDDERAQLPPEVHSRGVPEGLEVLRLVEIEGVDLNTCCGTHVENLSHIQMIKFVGKDKKKDMTKVTFLAGGRLSGAVSNWSKREKIFNTIFQTNPNDHISAAKRIVGDLKAATSQNKSLLKELAEFIGKDLAQTSDHFLELHRNDADMSFLMNVLQVVTKERSDVTVFLSCGSKEGTFMLVGSPQLIKNVSSDVAKLLEGKGGGRPGTYRGKAGSFKKRSEVIELIKNAVENAKESD